MWDLSRQWLCEKSQWTSNGQEFCGGGRETLSLQGSSTPSPTNSVFSLFTLLSTSFSGFPFSRWFCSSVTFRMLAVLVDNKGVRGKKRKLLHCCYMWRHSWCEGLEGLEALCGWLLGGCHYTGMLYLLYRHNGWFIAISQVFTIFTLIEKKQVGEWSNCSLRKETDKVVKTCTKSHA